MEEQRKTENTTLEAEYRSLLEYMRNLKGASYISPKELQTILAKCIDSLKDYPINHVEVLKNIFMYFTSKYSPLYNFDYVLTVNDSQYNHLHRLNEIIKTVDKDFSLGTRELEKCADSVFMHWNDLCSYSEIYTALATIIICTDANNALDEHLTLTLIKDLDSAIQLSALQSIKIPYETNLSLECKYTEIRSEILTYYGHGAYSYLYKKEKIEDIPEKLHDYWHRLRYKHNVECIGRKITEHDIQRLRDFEKEGRHLFQQLAKHDK